MAILILILYMLKKVQHCLKPATHRIRQMSIIVN
nr:MAG TPA: hypothetical protein [Caudoviricetes sp.]